MPEHNILEKVSILRYNVSIMKKHAIGQSTLFMEEFGRHLIVSDDGRIQFTSRGKKELGALFARYGLKLTDITTLDAFQRQMREVNALEADRTERELAHSLSDPKTSESDKAFIRSMLGIPEPLTRPAPVPTLSFKAKVIDLAQYRASRQAA